MNWRLTKRKPHPLAAALSLMALTAPMFLTGCGSGLLGVEDGTTDSEITDEEETATGVLCSENMRGADPILGESVSYETLGYYPATIFRQTVQISKSENTDFDNPYQINYWDMNSDLSLDDGYSDQFDDAMELLIGTPDGAGGVSTSSSYASNNYEDLTFYGPALASCTGVVAATIVPNEVFNDLGANGSYHLMVGAIANGRTHQTVTIPVNAASLNWLNRVDEGGDDFSLIDTETTLPLFDRTFSIVLRNPETGEEITAGNLNAGAIDVSALAGQTVDVSIEATASGEGHAFVDDLVLKDDTNTVIEGAIPNGDFETGDLNGWTVVEPSEIQNMTGNTQTLEGVEVTRSFFTIPNKSWGRWTDVIHNPGTEAVTVRVMYQTNLGSDDSGFVFPLPASDDVKAVSEFDPDGDRDLGLVFGTGAEVTYESATADTASSYTSAGTDDVDHYFEVSIPAGGTVTYVNFVLMNGDNSGYYGDFDLTTARPEAIEAGVADILENFWTDGQYRTGMTQAQIDSIANF